MNNRPDAVILDVIQPMANALGPTKHSKHFSESATSMNSIASLDFERLTDALDTELASILPPLADDADIFGFAVFVPEDAGSAFMTYTFGRESGITAKPGTVSEGDQRYSPIEWIDTPPSFDNSNDVLESIVEKFEIMTENMDDEEADQAHDKFIDLCACSAMTALQRRMDTDSFGSIWYRVLMMTDDSHPVLKQAFESLNTGRALTEAKFMFEDDA